MSENQQMGVEKLSVSTVAFQEDENRRMRKINKKEAGKLTIATVARMKELEESGYIDIQVDLHEVLKEGDKILQRTDLKTGKVMTKAKETKKSKGKTEITKE